MVCDGTTCKDKETFEFVEGGLGGSGGQKIMCADLPLPKIFRKGGWGCFFGVCAVKQRNTVLLIPAGL